MTERKQDRERERERACERERDYQANLTMIFSSDKPMTRLDKKTVMAAYGSGNLRETIFICYVDASPEAQVTWYKGNVPIYQGLPYVKETEQVTIKP